MRSSSTSSSDRSRWRGAVFDTEKLAWLNGRYLREDYGPAELARLLRNWRFDDHTLEAAAGLAQPRMRTLGDFGPLASLFFADETPCDAVTLAGGLDHSEVAEWLLLAEWALEDLPEFTADTVHQALRALSESLGVKLRRFTRPALRRHQRFGVIHAALRVDGAARERDDPNASAPRPNGPRRRSPPPRKGTGSDSSPTGLTARTAWSAGLRPASRPQAAKLTSLFLERPVLQRMSQRERRETSFT